MPHGVRSGASIDAKFCIIVINYFDMNDLDVIDHVVAFQRRHHSAAHMESIRPVIFRVAPGNPEGHLRQSSLIRFKDLLHKRPIGLNTNLILKSNQ